MIKSIYIKNFKAYEKKTISLNKDSLIIGDNDSGKSTILEALDIFFNQDKIDKVFVRNMNEDVQIGIYFNEGGRRSFIKKTYKSKTFKLDTVEGDTSLIEGYKYVFISSNILDVKKLISELSIAKAISNFSSDIKRELETGFNNSINEVLNTIDGELMVIDSEPTSFAPTTTLKLDSAVKYDINTGGVPLEGRGSGFKKTVVYSLLTKSEYENVIIGIDEIENSLSINNAKELIAIINSKFAQSLITTHSTAIMSCVNSDNVVPIINGSCKTFADMISNLGNLSDRSFVLVEGKCDMIWVNAALSLIGVQDKYVVIQCGGCDNIRPVYDELTSKGFNAYKIKDGDTLDATCSLSKDCIELFIPLDEFNRLFGLSETSVPNNKDDFFSKARSTCIFQSDDSVKDIIASNVESFLDMSNPIISEIKTLLGI